MLRAAFDSRLSHPVSAPAAARHYPALRKSGNNALMTTRVLVVDDDPAIRSAVSRALRADYDVDEAEDGAEALARQAATPADAIVLDLLMPEVGGLEVCR